MLNPIYYSLVHRQKQIDRLSRSEIIKLSNNIIKTVFLALNSDVFILDYISCSGTNSREASYQA